MSGATALVLTVRRPEERGGSVYRFDEGPVQVGRRGSCAVRLPDPAVSADHLVFERIDGHWHARDLGSTHGSSLRGVPLAPGQAARLRSTELLTVGPYVVEVFLDAAGAPTTRPQDTERLARLLAADVLQRTAHLWWVWVRAGGPEDGAPVQPGQPLRLTGPAGGGDLRLNDPALDAAPLEIWAEGDGVALRLGPAGGQLLPVVGPPVRWEGSGPHFANLAALVHLAAGTLHLAPPAAVRPGPPLPETPAAPRVGFTRGERLVALGLGLLVLLGAGLWIWG